MFFNYNENKDYNENEDYHNKPLLENLPIVHLKFPSESDITLPEIENERLDKG